MQVSVESVGSIERRMTVGVDADKVDSEVQKRLQQAAKTVKIDGFRPGKVPFKLVQKRYGAGVRHEVINEVVRESFVEAVQAQELTPAGYPNIELKADEAGKDLEFIATFEVYPVIELGDLAALTVKRTMADIEESDIDAMIEQLRQQQSHMHAVERAAQDGDQVTIDFKGIKNGEVFEGGTATGHKLVLGSKSMIPGFEEGIIGMSAGDEKMIDVSFPEDYQSAELAGQAVQFEIKVHQVAESHLPELNDDFIARFGVKEGGMDAFREEVKRNMERELKKATRSKLKSKVIEALLNAHAIDVPKALVNEEINRMRKEMAAQFGGGQKIDDSMLPAELFQDQASKRVSTSLIINQYIEDNDITVDEERLKNLVAELAASYEDPEEVIDYIMGDKNQYAQFQALALEEQVIDSLLDKMQVEEIKVAYQDAIKPEEPEPEAVEETKE